jgi:hypothetical protein
VNWSLRTALRQRRYPVCPTRALSHLAIVEHKLAHQLVAALTHAQDIEQPARRSDESRRLGLVLDLLVARRRHQPCERRARVAAPVRRGSRPDRRRPWAAVRDCGTRYSASSSATVSAVIIVRSAITQVRTISKPHPSPSITGISVVTSQVLPGQSREYTARPSRSINTAENHLPQAWPTVLAVAVAADPPRQTG